MSAVIGRPLTSLAALAAVAAAVAFAPACGGETAVPQRVGSLSTPACPRLAHVVQLFGATMRNGGPAPLGAYFAVVDGRTVIRPPPGVTDSGAASMAGQLDNYCAQSETSGWCDFDSTLESCLSAVETLFYGPSRCGVVCSGSDCEDACVCGDGVCDPFGETAFSCPEDCAVEVACGNGTCEGFPAARPPGSDQAPEPYEICGACADDAGPGCVSCDLDCCVGTCGDGACDLARGETRATCEQDCTLGVCGDGVRMGGENADNCPRDGWADHCLNPVCRNAFADVNAKCVDARQVCGDGLCMGCEMWTCAADCDASSFSACLADDASCPTGSCGDGACDPSRGEDPRACPLDCGGPDYSELKACGIGPCTDVQALLCPTDCIGQPEVADRCGDGICERFENVATCPRDCKAEGCALSDAACATDGRRCAEVSLPAPITGRVEMRHAVIACGGGCEVITVCSDVCVQDGATARCVDCGWFMPQRDAACATDPTPYCITASTMMACVPDPANPDEPACAVERPVDCAVGCVAGRCLPCDAGVDCGSLASCVAGQCQANAVCGDGHCDSSEVGACAADCGTCGDGRCREGETERGCPADCACQAMCSRGDQAMQDEITCPESWAACYCADQSCQAWEASGPFACPGDCP